MEIIILICFAILSVFCICMLFVILFFMSDCNKRLCSLEDDICDIHLNKVSFQHWRSFKNDIYGYMHGLERDINGAFINIENVEDKIEDFYDFKHDFNVRMDAIFEDLKRTKVNVQRLNVCEHCNDFVLRSLSRKVTALMIGKDKKDAADN